jgi:hypothetical protein
MCVAELLTVSISVLNMAGVFTPVLEFFGLVEPRRRIQVQLVAEGDAKTMPGFSAGGLTLTATTGETLGAVMSRFNQFRGPDSQIRAVFSADGDPIPFSMVLTDPVQVYVKKI